MPSPSRRRGYLDRELRRNDTVKSGERTNNAHGRVTDATGIIDEFILPCPPRPAHAGTICCPHRELKQILPARRAIGYEYRTRTRTRTVESLQQHADALLLTGPLSFINTERSLEKQNPLPEIRNHKCVPGFRVWTSGNGSTPP